MLEVHHLHLAMVTIHHHHLQEEWLVELHIVVGEVIIKSTDLIKCHTTDLSLLSSLSYKQ